MFSGTSWPRRTYKRPPRVPESKRARRPSPRLHASRRRPRRRCGSRRSCRRPRRRCGSQKIASWGVTTSRPASCVATRGLLLQAASRTSAHVTPILKPCIGGTLGLHQKARQPDSAKMSGPACGPMAVRRSRDGDADSSRNAAEFQYRWLGRQPSCPTSSRDYPRTETTSANRSRSTLQGGARDGDEARLRCSCSWNSLSTNRLSAPKGGRSERRRPSRRRSVR